MVSSGELRKALGKIVELPEYTTRITLVLGREEEPVMITAEFYATEARVESDQSV